jgi:hypothetical protein
MANVTVGARVDTEISDALEKEAKRLGMKKCALVKTYVLDGLAGNNNETEQVMQTLLSVLEQIKIVMGLTGAALHLDVERQVLDLPQRPDESTDAYRQRLMKEYKQKVLEAIAKGGRIAVASANPNDE